MLLRTSLLFSVIVFASVFVYWGYIDHRDDKATGNDVTASIADLLGNGDTTGFARALAPRPFVFPLDHGPHPEYKHEWWYFTGNLDTRAGRHFGFQLTFFRIGLTPESTERTSSWATNQVYMAHFAVSDVQRNRFYNFERFSRGAAGLAGASRGHFRVWLEDWFVEEVDAADDSKLFMRLRAAEEDTAIDLNVNSVKPMVLQGDAGLSRKNAGPGNASYYYSATRLRTEGVINIGKEQFEVEGLSWLDREWSTSALGKDQVGWDWFALQLTDGREFTFYRLRKRDGSTDPFSRGTLVLPDGSSRLLALEDVQIEVRGHWMSPQTHANYPSRWRLRISSEDLDLDIQPYLPDQELDVSVRYWEGAVAASGTANGVPVTGSGYVELVGYDQADGLN